MHRGGQLAADAVSAHVCPVTVISLQAMVSDPP
jgi:hypothetical protein